MGSWKKVIVLASLLLMMGPQLTWATISPGAGQQKPSMGQIGEDRLLGDMITGDGFFQSDSGIRWAGSTFYYQMLALSRWVSWLSGWTR